jgi:pimeloyl-ACP methyl ester carboxylesterase
MPWFLLAFLAIAGLGAFSEIERHRLETRFPPIGRLAMIDGVRLHYTDTGELPGATERAPGRPIVLIHGASTSLLDFHASLVRPLAKRHRVVTLDRPGHGYSERPDGAWPDPAEQARLIHGLLTELDVHQPILVGHSWAGSAVLAYLLDYPHAASGGVLMAGGTHPWEGGVSWYNDLAGLPLIGQLFAYTLPMTIGRLTVDQGIASVFAPHPIPDGYRDRTAVDLTLRARTFLANAEDIRLLSPFLEQQSRRYAEIEHPLLLLTSDLDAIVPAWNHAERLVRQAPNAELVSLGAAGHALHHVQAERVVALIDRLDSRIDRQEALAADSSARLSRQSRPGVPRLDQ